MTWTIRRKMEKNLESNLRYRAAVDTDVMDEIVWAVDPQHDTLDSLASYLGKLIHELFNDTGIRCRLDFPLNLPAWPVTSVVRHNLFLTFKEALHNVLKHSAATEVKISFAFEPAPVTVKISDNGCGFDVAVLKEAALNGGPAASMRLNGLLNMRKRLQTIGGHCDIQTKRDHGTQVTLFSSDFVGEGKVKSYRK